MARQKGLIRVGGLLGDLSFYHSDGKDLVKTPGGASKEQIMGSPKLIRVRENMTEFGGSAHVGKAFRSGLAEVIDLMSGKYVTGRITGLFKQICNNGPGPRGYRNFEIVSNSMLLAGFNFNTGKILGSIFSPPYFYFANVDRNETTLKVPDFNTSNYVHSPAGATHFRLVNSASILSDYKYDSTMKKYNPTDPTIDGLNLVAYSAFIPVGGMIGGGIDITSTISGAPVMTPSAGLMGCIGIEFFQLVNGDYYLLNAENSMRLEAVF